MCWGIGLALPIWSTYGSLFFSHPGHNGVLDNSVGTGGPDLIHSTHSLCGGSGALCASSLVSAYLVGRRAGSRCRDASTSAAISNGADEITASMLAQLLEAQGLAAIAFPAGPVTHEIFAMLDPQPEDVMCLSALPPFGFVRARSVARQFRRISEDELLVGIRGFRGDVEKGVGAI